MKLIVRSSSNIKIEIQLIKDCYIIPHIKKTVRFVGMEFSFLILRISIKHSERRWK